jgi:ketosteroid isomerase-like protein
MGTGKDPFIKPRNSDFMKSTFFLNPYKVILRNKILHGFEKLNQGEYKALTNLFSDRVHYRFEGDHALGGERFTKQAVELWFERLLRLLPLRFEITSMLIQGMPWNTDVVIEFRDHVSPKHQEPYVNNGIQKIKIKWGKAVDVHTYVDTYKIQTALQKLAEHGVQEATAKPIEG